MSSRLDWKTSSALSQLRPSQRRSSSTLSHGFLGAAGQIGVFDAQEKFAAGVAGQQPVKQRRACSADVKIAGRRRGETGDDFRVHDYASRFNLFGRIHLRRTDAEPCAGAPGGVGEGADPEHVLMGHEDQSSRTTIEMSRPMDRLPRR